MKKITITLSALILAGILGTPLCHADSFTDVNISDDYYVAIEYLYGQSFIEGFEDGTYRPQETLDKATAVKMIMDSHNVAYPASVESTPYTDVPAGAWYAPYIVGAYNAWIIVDTADGLFHPLEAVTRAEFAQMLLLANGFTESTWGTRQIYSDVPANTWMTAYMNYAGKTELFSKDNFDNLLPWQPVNRGEAAYAIYMLKLIVNRFNSTFLLDQVTAYLNKIDANISSNLLAKAQQASKRLEALTQQAYRNNTSSNTVLAKAKISKGYKYLLRGKICSGRQNANCATWKTLAKTKATEATTADSSTASTANSISTAADAIE